MLICKVKGNVVATQKDKRLDSWKLLIVQTVGIDGKPQGEPFLSVDAAQAGIGDLALVARHGAAARAAMMAIRKSDEYAPANAVIIGIIDEVTDFRRPLVPAAADTARHSDGPARRGRPRGAGHAPGGRKPK